MGKIIDIEVLSKMPITKEFAELLFGDGARPVDIFNDIQLTSVNYINSNGIELCIFDDGEMEKGKDRIGNIEGYGYYPIPNAFQIVRYIDNYLQQENIKRINIV